MDFSNLATQIGALFGVQPSTLLLYIGLITFAANTTARMIPSDATGWLKTVRQVCSVIGAYVSSRVTSGVTIEDVAKAAAATPPIPAKIEATKVADETKD